MKRMSISRLGMDNSPVFAFQHLQQNFCFRNKKHLAYADVLPYYIITEGRDIIVTENNDSIVDIGFSCTVYRPKKIYISSNPLNFAWIVEQTIRDDFCKNFKNIKIDKTFYPPGEIKIGIHPSGKAYYTIDGSQMIVLYFLLLSHEKSIQLIPNENKFRKCTNFDWNSLRGIMDNLKISKVAEGIGEKILSGEIELPLIGRQGG